MTDTWTPTDQKLVDDLSLEIVRHAVFSKTSDGHSMLLTVHALVQAVGEIIWLDVTEQRPDRAAHYVRLGEMVQEHIRRACEVAARDRERPCH